MGIGANWTWICHICGDIRPNKFISVRIRDLAAKGHERRPGVISMNVRYCNDRKYCIEESKTFSFMKEGSTPFKKSF